MVESNPFLPDLEDDETSTPADAENTNFKQLRDYARKLERDNKSLTREVDGLRTFKADTEAEKRAALMTQVFDDVGLNPKHGALFLKLNPEGEVTADAVRTFAAEHELPVSDRAEPTPVPDAGLPVEPFSDGSIRNLEPPRNEPGFAPVQGEGSAGARFITDPEEASRLSHENPTEFARLYEAGRIKLERLPGAAR